MKSMSDPPQTRYSSAPQLPCSDRSWPRRCGPLLTFLGTPRTWGELAAWASEREVRGYQLRNMLAWLEGEGIAGTFANRRLLALGAGGILWRRYDLLRAS